MKTMRIEAIDFHPHAKNTLQGFADLAIADIGLRIFDCTVFEKDGRWWVRLPSRSCVDRNGEVKWQDLFAFGDRDSEAAFQKAALAALRFRFPKTFPDTLVTAKEGSSQ
jgi:hypothetical protein